MNASQTTYNINLQESNPLYAGHTHGLRIPLGLSSQNCQFSI